MLRGVVVAAVAPIGAAISGAIAIVQVRLATAQGVVTGFFTFIGGRLNAFVVTVQGVTNTVSSGVAVIVGKFQAIAASIGSAQGAGQRFGYAIGQALGQAIAAIAALGAQFFNAGANLIGQLINGVKSKIGEITATIAGVAGQVRAYLPFSPARVGPLSDLDRVDVLGSVTANVAQSAAPLTNAVGSALQGARNVIGLPASDPLQSMATTVTPGTAAPIGTGAIAPTPQGGNIPGGGAPSPQLSPPMGGGSIVVNYSPSITLPGGGAPSATDQANFREELQRNKDELVRIIQSIERNKSRVAYS
jgi:hypothetical protein